MAEAMASGLVSGDYRRQLEELLKKGEVGEPVEPQVLLDQVAQRASRAGKPQASERDLAAVLLERAGWTLLVAPQPDVSPEVQGKLSERGPAPATAETEQKAAAYRPRARHPTPNLEQFGRDLCQEALAGKLPTILGRDVELQGIMETLCRWTKRNPLLIGPAGVGKTAIVEGLAQRIVRGNVPAPIQNIRIFAIQASSLVSGAGLVGKLEERMRAVVDEASQDGIVLFIDEVHAIVGSGGMRQVSDVGSLLKPALAKGDIACIGATTDAEFHQFIEKDAALERRFQPLRIQELSADATLEILRSLQEKASRERSVTLSDQALSGIVLLAQQYLRNRHFPDKAIDILEQCVSHALLAGLQEVTPATVHDVVERMIGIPVELGEGLSRRLNEVKRRLIDEVFCPEEIADRVIRRLAVTMRGLDVVPVSPNAVLLVAATAGQVPELAARVLAEALYGSRDRLIEVDMTRFTHPADVNWLLGAPPGYVGYDNVMGFHLELAQRPWSVLLFKNVEASHPQAQEVLAQAFRSGFLSSAVGQKLYLSDATVVLTVTTEERQDRRIGFVAGEREEVQASPELASLLIPDLVAELDAWWSPRHPTSENIQSWVKQWLVAPLSERCKRRGLDIEWDPSVLAWLAEEISKAGGLLEGERLVEERLLPLLVPHLDKAGRLVLYSERDGSIQIRREKGA
jgi:ATP-dependent Clp protease ATP-binding subunit ClpC